jgi:hypothetical protein
MDLLLYARVLARFKILLLIGLVLAVAMALMSTVRVTTHGLRYRQSPTYLSYARIFVTQKGFPWGRLGVASPATGLGSESASAAAAAAAAATDQFADPSRLTSVATIYSSLVDTDAVRAIMLKKGPLRGTVQAAPVLDSQNNQPLPLISIAAYSDTPSHAVNLARRQTDALIQYVEEQQVTNRIPAYDRVSLTVVKEPGIGKDPVLARGRSKTLPIVVFLTVMVAFVGLAFILENVRPRVREDHGDSVVVAPTREAA